MRAPFRRKGQYFALPPRSTAKPGRRHGIHHIKMFPVQKRFQRRFRAEGSRYYETLQRAIDANTKRIVFDCQAYLDDYEKNGKPRCAVGIDRIRPRPVAVRSPRPCPSLSHGFGGAASPERSPTSWRTSPRARGSRGCRSSGQPCPVLARSPSPRERARSQRRRCSPRCDPRGRTWG